MYLSLYHCFCSYDDIIQSSLYETRYDDSVILSLIPVETIVGDRGGDDFLFLIHDSYCTFYAKSTKSI